MRLAYKALIGFGMVALSARFTAPKSADGLAEIRGEAGTALERVRTSDPGLSGDGRLVSRHGPSAGRREPGSPAGVSVNRPSINQE